VKRPGAPWLGVVALLFGCVYYNALYNAERLYEEAEWHRQAGRDSVADARYRDVIRKAASGFREEPEGRWADDALLLLGQARFRLGEMREARAALEQAAALADEDAVRLGAHIFLGATYVMAGDHRAGTPLLNEGLRGLSSGAPLAEGHLWRARVLLTAGEVDAGWWDLDRAGEAHQAARAPAALERIRWGVLLSEPERVREGVNRLLAHQEGGENPDTLVALVRLAADTWGAAAAADLLAGGDTASWARTPRGKIRLARATLLRQAGDTARAEAEIRSVANGFGASAAEARLELARWQLEQARDLVDAQGAERILLPAERDTAVARLLEHLGRLSALAEVGLSDPLGWFVAGEVARDGLKAPELARGLFLAYADAGTDEPWVPKALLAALDLTPDAGGRAWLRGRLEARGDNPYVLAAQGLPAPEIEVLEEALARRLEALARGP
jgi:hypothetical protein